MTNTLMGPLTRGTVVRFRKGRAEAWHTTCDTNWVIADCIEVSRALFRTAHPWAYRLDDGNTPPRSSCWYPVLEDFEVVQVHGD